MSGRTLLGTPPALLSPSLLLGGGVRPPQQQSAATWGGGPDPPSSRAHWTRLVFERYARGGCVHRAFEPNTPSSCRVLAFY